MQNLQKFYINGDWVLPHSNTSFPLLNPANEAQIGKIFLGDSVDVDRAVAAAKTAFARYAHSSKAERLALLNRLLAVSERRLEDLAQAMSQEMGAPISMARAAQADAAVGHLQAFIQALQDQEPRQDLGNGDIQWREPVGVCALITPWNWPINQIALKVIPALAAGCTCILKPSEHTPLSAMVYAEIIDEAGFPPGTFNLVQGDGPGVGVALSQHPDIHMVSFTGSTRAGIAITHNAANDIKRVTLELGGKSPNLVFADCDLEARVSASVWECMYNTGQSCDAPTRMLVARDCYDQAVEIVGRTVAEIKVGAPDQEGDHLGPLFDAIQYQRVQGLIEAGIRDGATLLAGGLGRPAGFEKGWYVRPTVFVDVHADMRIAREEIFGPVLVMLPFDDVDEAISMANDTAYGLAAYIQTNDGAQAEYVAARLRAGAIHINGGAYQYGSPFGGYKQSGNGREGGLVGLEEFQELKIIHPGTPPLLG